MTQEAFFAPAHDYQPTASYETLVEQYRGSEMMPLPIYKEEPLRLELRAFVNGLRGGALPDPAIALESLRSRKKPPSASKNRPCSTSQEPNVSVQSQNPASVHETAVVEADVRLGAGTRVWHQAQIRTRATVGERCVVGKGVFIDFDVVIGDDCKFQNYACVYHGSRLGAACSSARMPSSQMTSILALPIPTSAC